MPSSTTSRNNPKGSNQTDRPTVNTPTSLLDVSSWDGGQATQAAWFNKKLKEAEDDFGFVQLNRSATVAGASLRELVAVFSPSHGLEHASGENQGTFRNPERG